MNNPETSAMLRNTLLGNTPFGHRSFWMNLAFFGGCCLILSFPSYAQQQRASRRLSEAEFVSLAARCAPGAPPDTLLAVARTESNLYPNAISINRPKAAARRAGQADAELVLERQPKDAKEAKAWLGWFARHRYTVSIGLMQVNAETAPGFRIKPEQLLEPCTNLRVGAAILISAYTKFAYEIGEGFEALDAALSLYNAGDSTTGFRNGYVATVYAHAFRPRRSPEPQ
jgi:type IV secretion system protein VirB1